MSKYQYSYVDLKYVIEDPDEYIIPECQEACKLFWDKNIETFMVSNNDDTSLYVLLSDLSKENLEIIKNKMSTNPDNYLYSEYRGCYGIAVPGKTPEDVKKLNSLTEVFQMQDTHRYQTSEDFLSEYKTTDGEYEFDPETLEMHKKPNPALADATIEEALEKTNKKELYIPEENRVYESEMYLKWHERYKKSKEIDDMFRKRGKITGIMGKRMG